MTYHSTVGNAIEPEDVTAMIACQHCGKIIRLETIQGTEWFIEEDVEFGCGCCGEVDLCSSQCRDWHENRCYEDDRGDNYGS